MSRFSNIMHPKMMEINVTLHKLIETMTMQPEIKATAGLMKYQCEFYFGLGYSFSIYNYY